MRNYKKDSSYTMSLSCNSQKEKSRQQAQKVLMLASVASMIDQFNLPNIRLMQKRGYEVHVACNFKEGNTCNGRRIRSLQKTLRGMCVCVHQWDCPRSIFPVRACIRAYRQMLKLMEQHRFAWMHCQSPIGGAIARAAAHKSGVRVVYTAHGFHFYKGAPVKNWLLYYPVEKLLARWTDVLITVNREDEQFARRHLRAGKVCRTAGVGVAVKQFTACGEKQKQDFRKKYGIPKDALLLLSVGELNQGKNHRAVIRALAGLEQKNVYYMICGRGALRQKLRSYASRLGVAGRIRLPGFQEDVRPFYQNADLFVFPSLREGMPVSLIEAMAAGLACAVSDIRGSRELITDSRLRFAPGDGKRLREILETLLAQDAFRKKCGMRNQVRAENYDRSMVQEKMDQIYRYMASGCGIPGRQDRETKPLVSVLMGTYNETSRKQTARAIDSVLSQTLSDFEFLICDDGSSESFYDWLRAYCKKDARIRLLRNPKNRGLAATLNRCLKYARGDYIARMDADDISKKERLEKQVRFLTQHPQYAFAGCCAGMFGEHGVWGERRMEPYPNNESFLQTSPFIHPSVVFRKDALTAVCGYNESKAVLRAEDYELFLRLYAKGYRGCNLQEVLFFYREEPQSYAKRRYRYRISECRVRFRGFRELGILKGNEIYVGKPLIVGLLPGWAVQKAHEMRYGIAENDWDCDIKF